MILLLDGLNGTGKTTLAGRLARYFNLPICRVFRRPDDEHGQVHWGAFEPGVSEGSGLSAETQLLMESKVPFNTYVDDLYTADFVAKLKPPGLILDRSMPSSMVYGTVKGESVWQGDLGKRIWRHWECMLLEYGAPVHYFMLTGDYERLRGRCEAEHRWHPPYSTWLKYEALFQETVNLYQAGKSYVLDSTMQTVDGLFCRIVSVAEGGPCHL